jgi:hypothetical protein
MTAISSLLAHTAAYNALHPCSFCKLQSALALINISTTLPSLRRIARCKGVSRPGTSRLSITLDTSSPCCSGSIDCAFEVTSPALAGRGSVERMWHRVAWSRGPQQYALDYVHIVHNRLPQTEPYGLLPLSKSPSHVCDASHQPKLFL